MGLLQDKVAIVTGGSRGIGESIVRKFVEEGAKVAFTYRSSADRANAIIAEVGEDRAKAYQSDAASYESSSELIKNVLKDFGKIDILVNNAGITKDTLLMRMSEEQWDMVINTNLKSVFNLTKGVSRTMMKARSGSIINISSVVGVMGNPGQANYVASKAGVIGFSKTVAKELGSRGIRCNAVAPGFIETDMTDELDEKTKEAYMNAIPLKRLGRGEEVANVCLFLASDLSSYVSGQTLNVCGAMCC